MCSEPLAIFQCAPARKLEYALRRRWNSSFFLFFLFFVLGGGRIFANDDEREESIYVCVRYMGGRVCVRVEESLEVERPAEIYR